MNLKRIVLVLAMAALSVVAAAQSTMTDIQVLDYVKNGVEQGKSRQEMLAELAARGVTKEQAERVRALYESRQTENARTAEEGVRSHTVSGEVDLAPETFAAENEGDPVIYGRDIFRNRNLNFAPSENLATPKNYRLGPGDEVIIDIFGANQATLRSKISPEGSINVDVLGPLYLNGMTIDEANKYLKRKLASIYGGLNRSSTGTDIRLSLGQIRSIQVNVLGDVENPGTYTTSAFATVFHVLYLAGGVSGPGTLRDIIVNRDGEVIAKVDVYDFLMNGSRSSDIRLEEGDVVMVHPYSVLVKVGGEVKRQMSFELKEGETLADVIKYAGGFSTGAFTDNVGVVRQNGKSYEVRTVDAEDYGSFRMEDGDEVTVSKLNSFYENRIAVTGAVYQPGTYELNSEVKTVKGLVQKAGGLLPEAFTNRAVLHREHEDKTLEVISLNLGRVMSGADPDIRLQKNDELFITRSSDIRQLGTMSISGMVVNPGTFPFASKTTVEDIIIMAGGLQEGASTARVDISRRKRDSNGLVVLDEVGELISVPLSEDFTDNGGAKTYLEPYDEVIVHQSPSYNVQTHVTVTGEANFAGPFTLTTRNERLSDLVKKAGGVTPYAYLEGARLFRNMGDDERRQLLEILNYRGNDRKEKLDTSEVYQMAEDYMVSLNLASALANPGGDDDIALVEGDVLDIPVAMNTVRVIGAVMMPAVISYNPGHTARHYINSCGGYTQGAKRGKTYVVHANGSSERAKFGMKLKPGDDLVIPEKNKKGLDADTAFSRAAQITATVSSLAMAGSYLFLMIDRMSDKNN